MDIAKLPWLHKSRRMAAIASLKVGRDFRYQLVARGVGAAPACSLETSWNRYPQTASNT
jgi:hypothetical protein